MSDVAGATTTTTDRDERVETYAKALFEVARSEKSLGVVEDQLFRIARTFEDNDELRDALTDTSVPPDRRLGIVEDLLGKRALPLVSALVSFIVAAGRARDLPAIIDKLVARAAETRDEAVAEVRAAVELSEEQTKKLADALEKATGKKVAVKVVIDPDVLGGIIAQVGDTVIDGSVRHRLEQLRGIR